MWCVLWVGLGGGVGEVEVWVRVGGVKVGNDFERSRKILGKYPKISRLKNHI